jgi:hypothetical protein
MRAITRNLSAVALAASTLLMASAPAWAGTTVSYTKPEEFTDLPFVPQDREQVLHQLTDYLVKLGSKLPEGQELNIEITDIDLAGRLIPSRRAGNDLRVMNGGADWPRIRLRYTLQENGRQISHGEAALSDMNYMNNANRVSANESLRYEKKMIDDWFYKTFGIKAGA